MVQPENEKKEGQVEMSLENQDKDYFFIFKDLMKSMKKDVDKENRELKRIIEKAEEEKEEMRSRMEKAEKEKEEMKDIKKKAEEEKQEMKSRMEKAEKEKENTEQLKKMAEKEKNAVLKNLEEQVICPVCLLVPRTERMPMCIVQTWTYNM